MFKRWRLRKLAKVAVEGSIILSGTPTMRVIEPIERLFGREILFKLLSKNFQKIVHDPIMLEAIKKVSKKRTNKYIRDLVDLMEEDNKVAYTRNPCFTCGSGVYKIGKGSFCLECHIKSEKENKYSKVNDNVAQVSATGDKEVPPVQ